MSTLTAFSYLTTVIFSGGHVLTYQEQLMFSNKHFEKWKWCPKGY